MKDTLKIFVERIRDGEPEEIQEELLPLFMDIHEEEMRFEHKVALEGTAYVTDDWLILRMHIQTKVQLTCSVCNNKFEFEINIQDFMHEEPLENIRDKVFDILPVVREHLLLAVPFYPQCGITTCLHRKEIEPYLKKDHPSNSPFKDL